MADDDWAPPAASPLAEITGTGPRPAHDVVVPGFTDLREVARGGDAIVYRARQPSVDRDVAIKVFQVTDPADAARFRRELEITVRLGRQHPHIVTVIDTTTTTAGAPCLVMEFHDLGSLHDRLRETGPLPVSDVVAAGTAVADALAFAHAHGVLHRDVKPQNVLVLPTSYVLSDFGIARMADAGHTATLERFSYRHASPQVLDGLPPTEADDVWSLGSTLFTLLDGRAPFASLDPDDDTALAYLRRVRTGQRRPLARDDVPADVRDLIEACLVPDREQRLGTAAEALRRLRRIRTEERSWNPGGAGAVEVDVATRERPEAPDGGPADRRAASPEPSVGTGEAGWAPEAEPTPGAAAASAGPAVAPGEEQAAEPAAVAPSVLAHVASRRDSEPAPAPADADHTGVAPEPDGPEGRAPGRAAAEAEEPGGGTWRRVAAFIGGALLVGAAIGVGSAFLQRGDDDPAPPATQDSGPVPQHTGDMPSDPPDVQVVAPARSPRQLVIDRDHGTSVELSWTEPEQPVDLYVVVRPESADEVGTPEELGHVRPPLTRTTIEGLDPDGSDCFAVIGMALDERETGVSEIVCR